MVRSVGPEGDREVARDQVDARLLHQRADGALGDAVQLVDVRRAHCLVDALVDEHHTELYSRERDSPALSHLMLITLTGPPLAAAIESMAAKSSPPSRTHPTCS